ncbi:hypothetical protein SJY04_20580 [Aeromonas dhakensis]|uniref:hypothetical protein n=1 Tax=Aeromonas dhakensis TaxID=196024 RepID=UPI0029D4A6CC|nr:hypothetical protein [Aeromonas dhakensis]MDX7743517.1 hypothetical protein [Aeromonas dhakensis]
MLLANHHRLAASRQRVCRRNNLFHAPCPCIKTCAITQLTKRNIEDNSLWAGINLGRTATPLTPLPRLVSPPFALPDHRDDKITPNQYLILICAFIFIY